MRNDAQTDVLLGGPRSAICVQRFDDSLNSAIHITYRISLRSSSLREPRYPSTGVVVRVVGVRARRTTAATEGRATRNARARWGGAEGGQPGRTREATTTAPRPPERRELLHSAACPRAPNPRGAGREHAEASRAPPEEGRGSPRPATKESAAGQFARGSEWIPVMILPQVHLRKPCYDFSFL